MRSLSRLVAYVHDTAGYGCVFCFPSPSFSFFLFCFAFVLVPNIGTALLYILGVIFSGNPIGPFLPSTYALSSECGLMSSDVLIQCQIELMQLGQV